MRFHVARMVSLWGLFLFLACPCLAGTGTIRDSGNGTGKLLDLNVYFAYDENDFGRWQNVFRECSQQMWVATDGNLRLGQVRFSKDKAAEKTADVVVGATGSAYATGPFPGLGSSTGRLFIFQSELNDPQGTPSLSMVLTHELGHYIFGLGDEYTGFEFRNVNGVVAQGEKKQTAFCATASSAEQVPGHTCLMSDNNQPDKFFQFCLDGSHPGAHLLQNSIEGGYNVNDQQRENQTSCWGSIARVLGINKPSQPPSRPMNEQPPSPPDFATSGPDAVVVVMVQDSTAFDAPTFNNFMQAALRGLDLVRLPQAGRGGDFAGVFTFTATLSEVAPITRITSRAQIDAIQAGARGLTPAGTTVNIEQSLRAAIARIQTAATQANTNFASRTIVMVVNGANDQSDLRGPIVQELKNAGIKVNITALAGQPQAPTSAALAALAQATGGTWAEIEAGVANTPPGMNNPGTEGEGTPEPELRAQSLADNFDEEIEDELADGMVDGFGGFVLDEFTVRLAANSSRSEDFLVDSFVERVAFQVDSDEGGPFLLSLQDPQGTVIDLQSPPANIAVESEADYLLVVIDNPATGTWRATLSSQAAQTLNIEAYGFGEDLVTIDDELNEVAFPQPLAITAEVAADDAVVGCSVLALVIHPDGRVSELELFDDGDRARHNDQLAADGVYSNFFVDYSSSGDYLVVVSVVNTNGRFTKNHLGNEPNRPQQNAQATLPPAPPFEREAESSFLVTAVPAGGGRALLAPGNLTVSSAAANQAALRWSDTNGGGTTFTIEKSLSGVDGFVLLTQVPAGTTEFVDANTGNAEVVFYRVLAGRGELLSPASEVVQLYPRLAGSLLALDRGGQNFNPDSFDDSSGFCFVATAAYGSYLAPQVQPLREFRNRYLLTSAPGRAVVKAYYAWSPRAANFIAQHEWARVFTRLALTPMIFALLHPWWTLVGLLGCGWWWRRRRLALPASTC